MSNKETDCHVLKLLFTPLLVPPFFPCVRVRQDISLVTLALLRHCSNKLYWAGHCCFNVCGQCVGCQRGISQCFFAGAKGGTDIWEGLAWSRTKN